MQIKTKRYRQLLVVTFMVFIFLMIFEVVPRVSSFTGLCYSLYIQQRDLTESDTNNLFENKLAGENRKLSSEIKHIAAEAGKDQTLSSIITYLDEIAAESNADIIAIKPGKLYEKENLRIMPLELTISADYEGIYNLLRFAENSDKIILFREIVIKSTEEGNGLDTKARIEVYLNL